MNISTDNIVSFSATARTPRRAVQSPERAARSANSVAEAAYDMGLVSRFNAGDERPSSRS